MRSKLDSGASYKKVPLFFIEYKYKYYYIIVKQLFFKELSPLLVGFAPLAYRTTNMPGGLLAIELQVSRTYSLDFWTSSLLQGVELYYRRSTTH